MKTVTMQDFFKPTVEQFPQLLKKQTLITFFPFTTEWRAISVKFQLISEKEQQPADFSCLPFVFTCIPLDISCFHCERRE